MEQSKVGKEIPACKSGTEGDKDPSPYATQSSGKRRGQPTDRPAGRLSSLADREQELQTRLWFT